MPARTKSPFRASAPSTWPVPAYELAVRWLAARALTAREVKDRLFRRGFSPEDAAAALTTLAERGYLDDRALAYNVASSLAGRKAYGRPRVVLELRRRGFSRSDIDEAVRRAYAGLDEEELAVRALARMGAGRTADQRARALLRRGFPKGLVLRVLRKGNAGASGLFEDEEGPAGADTDDPDVETSA